MTDRHKTNNSQKIVFISIAAVLFLVILIGAAGVYGFLSTNPVIRAIGKIIPYPVVLVDGHIITYAEYANSFTTLRNFLENQGDNIYSDGEIEGRVLERLITNQILDNMAEKRDIAVFDYEVEKAFQDAVENLGQDANVEKNIEELYGWTVQEYKDNIVYPFVLQKKLSQAIYDGGTDAEEKFSKYLQDERATTSVIYLVSH